MVKLWPACRVRFFFAEGGSPVSLTENKILRLGPLGLDITILHQ